MPLFEYQCPSCSHRFEVLVRNESDIPQACPECSTVGVEKQLSAFAVSSGSSEPSEAPRCEGCSPAHCPYNFSE